MKYIDLTKGKKVMVDDEDFEYLSQWKWQTSARGYAVRGQWNGERKNNDIIIMSRMLLNCPDDKEVDHINGDRLDNRKENLRIVTKKNNRRNRAILDRNKTGYKGVVEMKDKFRWKRFRASIGVDGKNIYLGYFYTAKEAYMAYRGAAKRYFGEYARADLGVRYE